MVTWMDYGFWRKLFQVLRLFASVAVVWPGVVPWPGVVGTRDGPRRCRRNVCTNVISLWVRLFRLVLEEIAIPYKRNRVAIFRSVSVSSVLYRRETVKVFPFSTHYGHWQSLSRVSVYKPSSIPRARTTPTCDSWLRHRRRGLGLIFARFSQICAEIFVPFRQTWDCLYWQSAGVEPTNYLLDPSRRNALKNHVTR